MENELSENEVSVVRPHNALQTRAAILKAAQRLFSQRGYEYVGVRDIAALIGVNAALVIRYFGSKERLFTEAVTEAFNLMDAQLTDRETIGEQLIRYLLQEDDEETFYPLLALLRSASSPQGSHLLRQGLERQFIQPLALLLDGEQPLLRATLIASTLLGIAMMQDVLNIKPLIESEKELLIARVGAVIQHYVEDSSF